MKTEPIIPDIIHMKIGSNVIILKPYPTTSIKGNILVHFYMNNRHLSSNCYRSISEAVADILEFNEKDCIMS